MKKILCLIILFLFAIPAQAKILVEECDVIKKVIPEQIIPYKQVESVLSPIITSTKYTIPEEIQYWLRIKIDGTVYKIQLIKE